MKVKHLLGIVLVLLLFLYVSFITVVPSIMQSNFDRHKFSQNLFFATKMKVSFTKASFYSTPSLGIGLKLNDFKVVYSDDKPFFDSVHADFEVSALGLLAKNIEFKKMVFDNANVDLLILPTGQYKINDYLSTNYSGFGDKIASVSPSVIELNNYKFSIPDLRRNSYEEKKGESFLVSKDDVGKYVINMSKGDIKLK